MTRALIVHHSDVVRAGIAALLQEGSVADSTASVGSVYEAFRLATAFPPRAVLFDFSANDGPDACRLLSGIWPRPRLIALVGDERQVGPAVAVAAGADAVVAIERVSRDVFLNTTRAVLAGMGPIAVGFSAATTDQRAGVDGSPTDVLTRREREMLYLIGEGLTNREIADALVLSVKTVETHRSNLSRKLNIRSRAGLMRLAVVGGISPSLAGGVA
jgi:DNA-binding NarL/FixJ family response regulator